MAVFASPKAMREKLVRLLTTNYVTVLSRKTKLSRATVTKFFNEETIRPENLEKIYDATLELINSKEEMQQNREKLIHKLGLPPRQSAKMKNN